MHATLAGTGLTYAGATADAVAERLDAWVQGWSAQRREVCGRPDAVAGDPEVGTVMRVQCLRRGRAAFETSIDVLATADTDAVRQALATTESLVAPESGATGSGRERRGRRSSARATGGERRSGRDRT